jgi:hypothetical protein
MKKTLFFLLTLSFVNAFAQDKHNYVHFNKLTEVPGTEYVIASLENWGKMLQTHSEYLVFINTKTTEKTQVDFPLDSDIIDVQQVKIDSLGIHFILVNARTIDLDLKNGIDWNDPSQLYLISIDGKEKKQLTENDLFVRTWVVNRTTGTIVITGHVDSNKNNKYDKTDKNLIYIYDLKTGKLLGKI